MYYFQLAERLGKTVEAMLDEISSAELTMWIARDELVAAEREKQQRLADKGMKRR